MKKKIYQRANITKKTEAILVKIQVKKEKLHCVPNIKMKTTTKDTFKKTQESSFIGLIQER